MSKLFGELKRRNVFKVGVAYVAVSWALVQAADILLPTFGAPEGFLRGFYIVLGLGFPVALLFAWAYEVTPQGVKKTGDIKKPGKFTAQSGQKINLIIIGALVLAVGLLLYDKFAPPGQQVFNVAEGGETSIAVLPFADLSPESDQEYFSDGMTEEILNVLVKVPNLKVAGRTSSFAYKGRNENLTTIGEALNVEFLVEGSVRKSENRLRITAQLIRASDGFHLWSDTYDRELTDIFEVQDEISRAIATALSLSLGIENVDITPNETADIAAYEDYLRALALFKARGLQNLAEAIDLLNSVTIRDPNFAPGWELLSAAYSVYPNYLGYPLADVWDRYLTLAELAANRALELDPASPDAHMTLGNVFTDRMQWAKAEEYNRKALELDPDSGHINQHYAENFSRMGYYEEALEKARRAVELEPLSPIIQNVLGYMLADMKQYDEARELLLKSWQMDPTLFFPIGNIILMDVTRGDYDNAHNFYSQAMANDVNYPPQMLDFLAALKDGASEEELLAIYEPAQTANFRVIKNIVTGNKVDYIDQLGLGLEYSRYGNNFLMTGPARFVRDEPGFKDLVHKAGLYDHWKATGVWADDCRPISDDDFECDP